ncbi:MAG: GNAT family N-acetyltransferase, partial [Elainellaceae cyanobacterium]
MYRLVVHPDYRRWGIATALVTEAEARFRQQGVKRITILVEKDHVDAMSFWQSVSYIGDERIRRFFHNF